VLSVLLFLERGKGETKKLCTVVPLSPISASVSALYPAEKSRFKNRGRDGLLKKRHVASSARLFALLMLQHARSNTLLFFLTSSDEPTKVAVPPK